MPTPKQPLTSEEKALRKQQRLRKEAEKDALVEAVRAKEMDAYFQGLPSLVLNLLSALNKESIDYTLKQPEPDKFKLIIHNSDFRFLDNSLNFALSKEGYSYSNYVNLVNDFDYSFLKIASVRRSRLEEEENHRKRQAARAKLTGEERKLLGL